MTAKKNIIFLSLVKIDNLNDRGIYHDLLRQFINEGHKVTVVCPIERKYNLESNLIEDGNLKILQVKTLNIQKCSLFEKGLSTLSINFLIKRGIKKYLRSIKFDIILYATPPITFYSIVKWLKNVSSAKTYLLLKDIFPQNAVDMGMFRENSILHNYFKSIEKKLYHVSDRIGCMSPANKSYLLSRFPNLIDKLEINPNSIEINPENSHGVDIKQIRRTYNLPVNSTIFIYGGNLGKPQGTEFLLPIIDEMSLTNESTFFLIVGDGTDYEKLNNWFLNKKPKNAKLIKSLPREEYDKLVAASDVGLIVLRKEFTIPNFPSRLLTYLENKIPVLCFTDTVTDIGKITEENNFGFWSLYGDINAANSTIKFISENITKRKEMGILGYEFLKKYYNSDISSRLILQIGV
jgi:glycosyltransferase involved in cell wall biosynthesis